MQQGDVIAFIGVGTMGAPMARQLIGAGFVVKAFDPVAAAVEALVRDGALAATSPADAAHGAAAAVLSLPGPAQVVEVVSGAGGILSAESCPPVIVDFSTNSVETVGELRGACERVGVAFLDAPVSGGVIKATDGTLAVMVGGTDDDVAAARPLLDAVGGDVVHVGPSGSGTIAKIVNNQIFLSAAVLVQEAYVLGTKLGMDPSALHQVIAASSGAPYTKLAPFLLSRRFEDVMFKLGIAAKDVSLAVESAEASGVPAPLTTAALSVYEAAVESGDGELAFHATLKELERQADIELPVVKRPPRPEQS